MAAFSQKQATHTLVIAGLRRVKSDRKESG
jgi:hypothetical protein